MKLLLTEASQKNVQPGAVIIKENLDFFNILVWHTRGRVFEPRLLQQVL